MAFTERLAMLITANGTQAMGEFKKTGTAAERSLATVEKGSQRVGTQLTRVGAGMVVLGGVMVTGMYKAAQAAGEAEASNIRLLNTIENQPALAGASAQAFYDQAAALQEVTVFADEATVAAQSMLGQFGLNQDQIMELIPLVQDYAAKTGTDLVTAARNVGKATAGTNMTLKRAGVDFDAAAFAADHFGATVEALQGYAGGFAEQEGQTLAGQLEILKNRFGEIAESVGGGAADAFGTFTGVLTAVSDRLDGMSEGSQNFLGQMLTYASVGSIAAGGLMVLAGQGLKSIDVFKRLANTVAGTRVQLALLNMGGAGFAGVAAGALAAGFAIAQFSKANEQAAKVRNFADALKAESEGLENATNEALAHVLATDGAINNYDELGISAETIVAAIRGEGAAWRDLQAAREEAAGVMGDNDVHNPEVEQRAQDIYHLVGAVDSQRNAYSSAQGAQSDFEEALASTGATAEDTAGSIDELTADIDDYLSRLFDVPEAQRNLQESFATLNEKMTATEPNWGEQAGAMQDVVEQTAEVIQKQQEQGASQASLDATINGSIYTLAAMRNSGALTAQQFSDLTREIEGIPHAAQTTVSTPGAPEAINNLRIVKTTIDGIDKNVVVRVSVPNLGAIAADVQGAAAALHSLRNSKSEQAAGGRSAVRGGVATAAPPQIIQLHVDGEKMAEVVARHDFSFDTGRGDDTAWD